MAIWQGKKTMLLFSVESNYSKDGKLNRIGTWEKEETWLQKCKERKKGNFQRMVYQGLILNLINREHRTQAI